MTDEDFSKLVAEGMDAIPDEFAEHIDNVVVVFADEPSEQQRQELTRCCSDCMRAYLRPVVRVITWRCRIKLRFSKTRLSELLVQIKKRYVNKLLKLFGTKLLIILV